MEITILKNYKGQVSVRDYIVKKCVEDNIPLIINHQGAKMTLTPDELRNKIVHRSPMLESKHGTPDYQLLNYKWEPDVNS